MGEPVMPRGDSTLGSGTQLKVGAKPVGAWPAPHLLLLLFIIIFCFVAFLGV